MAGCVRPSPHKSVLSTITLVSTNTFGRTVSGVRAGINALVSTVTLLLVVGCGGASDMPTKPTPPVVTIEVSSQAISLAPTSEAFITATPSGAALNDSVTWTSSAPAVATVKDNGAFGIITGVTEGTTTVYAMLAADHSVRSDPILVTVARVPALASFTVDSGPQLIVGDTGSFKLHPINTVPRASVAYTFVSLNPSIATVNPTTGVVTGVAPGTASITVTATGTGTGLITNSLSATTQALIGTIQTRSRHITIGSAHICALKSTGQASCWGWNAVGQLGDGTTTDRSTSTPVAGTLNFVEISAGFQHTCALTSAGVAYCWGYGANGRLGNGDIANRTAPTQVSSAASFAMIESGGAHSCTLTASGTARCWGWNLHYELGDLTQADRVLPTLVQVPGAFTTISGGLTNTCALTAASTVYCWGDGGVVLQEGGAVYADVVAGRTANCALSTRGRLTCWGTGDLRTLFGTVADGPLAFLSGYTLRTLVVGDDHACVLTVANDAYCWGRGGSGQLGNGGTDNAGTLKAVSGGLKFVELAAGEKNTCGLTTDNLLYCWGSNSNGQLGRSPGPNALTPQLMPFTP